MPPSRRPVDAPRAATTPLDWVAWTRARSPSRSRPRSPPRATPPPRRRCPPQCATLFPPPPAVPRPPRLEAAPTSAAPWPPQPRARAQVRQRARAWAPARALLRRQWDRASGAATSTVAIPQRRWPARNTERRCGVSWPCLRRWQRACAPPACARPREVRRRRAARRSRRTAAGAALWPS